MLKQDWKPKVKRVEPEEKSLWKLEQCNYLRKVQSSSMKTSIGASGMQEDATLPCLRRITVESQDFTQRNSS